jgi:hypothetical protein
MIPYTVAVEVTRVSTYTMTVFADSEVEAEEIVAETFFDEDRPEISQETTGVQVYLPDRQFA